MEKAFLTDLQHIKLHSSRCTKLNHFLQRPTNEHFVIEAWINYFPKKWKF